MRLYLFLAGVGRVVALIARPGRKVRTPQGRVVGNAHRGQPQGKCHRKDTATSAALALFLVEGCPRGKGEKVR